MTLFVEIIQMFIGRSTDIDDVILNTLGIIIGYGIFLLFNLTLLKLIHKKYLKIECFLSKTSRYLW